MSAAGNLLSRVEGNSWAGKPPVAQLLNHLANSRRASKFDLWFQPNRLDEP